MKHYEEQIIYAIENNIKATDEIAEEWARLEKGEINTQKSILSTVGPLTETEWGQGCYYNTECPECEYPPDNCEDQCDHAAVGCIAVAMGQVMRYHEYPDYGYGDTTYTWGYYVSADFGNTHYLWFRMTPTFGPYPKHNGATALYHCGASVGMHYGEKSGAVTSKVVYALKYHFNYAATSKYIEKDDYTDTEWIDILKDELNAGRPMVYRGVGTGNHAWVCRL
jgi:hypothetical protein